MAFSVLHPLPPAVVLRGALAWSSSAQTARSGSVVSGFALGAAPLRKRPLSGAGSPHLARKRQLPEARQPSAAAPLPFLPLVKKSCDELLRIQRSPSRLALCAVVFCSKSSAWRRGAQRCPPAVRVGPSPAWSRPAKAVFLTRARCLGRC